ncbi:MAG: FtsX-like permease family protein [Chromatiales bacterium]|jgi:ABC-type lipoprotein release transport system permease subunit
MTLRLAWRNIWRNPRRTWLTVAAIAFCSTLLIFSITLQFGAYDMMIDNALRTYTGHLQVQREGYQDKPRMRSDIPDATSLADRIRAATGAAVAVRAQGFALAASEDRTYGVMVVGVQPDHEPEVSTIPGTVRKGRPLRDPQAQEALIGAVLARNLKVGVGDELTLLGNGRDGSVAATVLRVAGIFESGSKELDRGILEMPLRTFQDVFTMGEGAHAIVMRAADLEHAQPLAARTRSLLPPGEGLRVLDWERLMPGLKQLIQADKLNGWFVYGALILVVTLSITNTFLMAVLERTREFGILLALGMRPLRIGRLVMLESLLLVLTGLAIGLMLGGLITAYFAQAGFTYPGMAEIAAEFNFPTHVYPQVSALAVLLGPVGILVFTMAAALYPALRIRRLQPVEAMTRI